MRKSLLKNQFKEKVQTMKKTEFYQLEDKIEKKSKISPWKIQWVMGSFVLLVVTWVVVGSSSSNFQSNKESSVADPTITPSETFDENLLEFGESMDLAWDISNPQSLYDHSDVVALVKVDETEYMQNYNPKTKESTASIMTYHKGSIEATIKGTAEKDIILVKQGGHMPWEEWIKHVDDAEKLIDLAKSSGADTSTMTSTDRGLIPEEGKTYLAYLRYNSLDQYYYVVGFDYGFMEVKEDTLGKATDQLWVKDNKTNTFVPITSKITF